MAIITCTLKLSVEQYSMLILNCFGASPAPVKTGQGRYATGLATRSAPLRGSGLWPPLRIARPLKTYAKLHSGQFDPAERNFILLPVLNKYVNSGFKFHTIA